jgi:hypothetical protein
MRQQRRDVQFRTRPAPDYAAFLGLTVEDVRETAAGPLPLGTALVWRGLSTMMERKGFRTVGELGSDTAAVWASHLDLAGRPAR